MGNGEARSQQKVMPLPIAVAVGMVLLLVMAAMALFVLTTFVPVSKLSWGSWPEWLAAMGTLLTVTGSLVIAIVESRRRRESEELLAAERARARQADASSVVSWIETNHNGKDFETTLHLLNSGVRPVFAITMVPVVYGTFQRGQRIASPVLGPGVDLTEPFNEVIESLVSLQGAPGNLLEDPAGRIGVKLIFRDADGLCWERGIDGILKERDWNFADVEFPAEPTHDH